MSLRVYEFDESEYSDIDKVLKYDPALDKNLTKEELDSIFQDEYKSVIFTRQEYSVKDGKSLNLKDNTYYLYVNANDDFLNKAEKMFKHDFKTIKRVDPEEENKVIKIIKEEESKVNSGFGSIFG